MSEDKEYITEKLKELNKSDEEIEIFFKDLSNSQIKTIAHYLRQIQKIFGTKEWQIISREITCPVKPQN